MTLETEIYQILKKHRLSLKKREEVIVDLLDFINKREKQLTIPVVIVSDFCECEGVQDLHAMTGECRKCGKECDY